MRPYGLLLLATLVGTCAAQVRVRFMPAQPLIDSTETGQRLSVDFALTNASGNALRLERIDETVLDSSGRLVLARSVNSNGLAPGIAAVNVARIEKSATASLFNPLDLFPVGMPLQRIRFTFFFDREDTAAQAEANRHRSPEEWDERAEVEVRPLVYFARTRLVLPMPGRVYVWDGHDALSHHRRVPLTDARVQAMGLHANSNRYAVDLVTTDAGGRMHSPAIRSREDWFCYGAEIDAPGDGIVAEAVNDLPENDFRNGRRIEAEVPGGADPGGLGNHVLIDHGDGEFSLLLHMKKGSVVVRVGDRVRAGERLGQVGFSGDAIFPHLHYALMNGPRPGASEGLPAYFHGVTRLWGERKVEVPVGEVETGEFVERH